MGIRGEKNSIQKQWLLEPPQENQIHKNIIILI